MKRDFVEQVRTWAMPFSPINPVDPNEMFREMKLLAAQLTPEDIDELLDAHRRIGFVYEGETFCYLHFMWEYVQLYGPQVSDRLFRRLQSNGPAYLIDIIGSTQMKENFAPLTGKLVYEELDKEARMTLAGTIDMLENKDGIAYLENLKTMEPDPEVLKEINMAVDRLKAELWK